MSATLTAGAAFAASNQLTSQDLVKSFDTTQRARETGISGYTAMEHYIVRRNDNPEIVAELTARSTYLRGKGKTYEVLSRKGSGFMQSQVLDRVLDHEKELYQPQNRMASVVTTDNYDMKLLLERETVNGRDCYVIELHPKNEKPEPAGWQSLGRQHHVHISSDQGYPFDEHRGCIGTTGCLS